MDRVLHSWQEHLCVEALKVNRVLNMKVFKLSLNAAGCEMGYCSRNTAHPVSDGKLLLLSVNSLSDYLHSVKEAQNKQVAALLLSEMRCVL